MDIQVQKSDPKVLTVIGVLSVAIPVVVAVLLYMPPVGISGFDFKFLPHLNAALNSATSLCLLVGFIAIKSRNIPLHRTMMASAVAISTLFLVSYVIYHASSEPTRFGGVGAIRYFYYFILITHIVLAAVVVPLVLLAVYYAYAGMLESHKRIVKWTFPVWFYVAVTGVLAYVMISPYYQ